MNYHEVFMEFEQHLMQDEKPSIYFYSLLAHKWFVDEMPFKLLSALHRVEQSPKHHPEGNVFIHTMMVLDEAAVQKSKSKNQRVFMWAALLHDLGKATTTKNRNGKITAYDHDIAGEGLTVDFLKTFEGEVGSEFITEVSKLVRWHMQILFVAKNLKYSNLGKMKSETDYKEVALLGLCDRLGRGELDEDKIEEIHANIEQFLNKCKSITK